jgi:hypothetical protein
MAEKQPQSAINNGISMYQLWHHKMAAISIMAAKRRNENINEMASASIMK